MSRIRLTRVYPHAPAKVWRALTEPAVMGQWGMRPEGYAPIVGTKFRLHGTPNPYWRGFVDCEVLEVRPGALLRYSWDGDGTTRPTELAYRLEPVAGGTQLTVEQRGFRGVRGFLFARKVMRPGFIQVLDHTFPAALAALDRGAGPRP